MFFIFRNTERLIAIAFTVPSFGAAFLFPQIPVPCPNHSASALHIRISAPAENRRKRETCGTGGRICAARRFPRAGHTSPEAHPCGHRAKEITPALHAFPASYPSFAMRTVPFLNTVYAFISGLNQRFNDKRAKDVYNQSAKVLHANRYRERRQENPRGRQQLQIRSGNETEDKKRTGCLILAA